MTTPTNGVHEFPAEAQRALPVMNETRPLYWSLWREVWENRFIWLAPLTVAGFVMLSFLITSFKLPRRVQAPPSSTDSILMPYNAGASAVLLTGFLVAFFYCADALYSERRDRSILFWKSLPVSDLTVVLSKIIVPVLVIPLIAFAIALLLQLVMISLGTAIVAVNGVNPVRLWSRVPLPGMTLIMLYGTMAHALWFAPLYAWVLLLSAWARRAVFVWVVLPPMILLMLERMIFRSALLLSVVRYRLLGALDEAFRNTPKKGDVSRLSQLDPLGFLTTPGLWAGLIFAALCVVAAVRLRRNREPI